MMMAAHNMGSNGGNNNTFVIESPTGPPWPRTVLTPFEDEENEDELYDSLNSPAGAIEATAEPERTSSAITVTKGGCAWQLSVEDDNNIIEDEFATDDVEEELQKLVETEEEDDEATFQNQWLECSTEACPSPIVSTCDLLSKVCLDNDDILSRPINTTFSISRPHTPQINSNNDLEELSPIDLRDRAVNNSWKGLLMGANLSDEEDDDLIEDELKRTLKNRTELEVNNISNQSESNRNEVKFPQNIEIIDRSSDARLSYSDSLELKTEEQTFCQGLSKTAPSPTNINQNSQLKVIEIKDQNVKEQESESEFSQISSNEDDYLSSERRSEINPITSVCGSEKSNSSGSHINSEKTDTAASNLYSEKIDSAGSNLYREKIDTVESNLYREKIDTAEIHLYSEKVDRAESHLHSEKTDSAESNIYSDKIDSAESNIYSDKIDSAGSNIYSDKIDSAGSNLYREKIGTAEIELRSEKTGSAESNLYIEKIDSAGSNLYCGKIDTVDIQLCNEKIDRAENHLHSEKTDSEESNLHSEKIDSAGNNLYREKIHSAESHTSSDKLMNKTSNPDISIQIDEGIDKYEELEVCRNRPLDSNNNEELSKNLGKKVQKRYEFMTIQNESRSEGNGRLKNVRKVQNSCKVKEVLSLEKDNVKPLDEYKRIGKIPEIIRDSLSPDDHHRKALITEYEGFDQSPLENYDICIETENGTKLLSSASSSGKSETDQSQPVITQNEILMQSTKTNFEKADEKLNTNYIEADKPVFGQGIQKLDGNHIKGQHTLLFLSGTNPQNNTEKIGFAYDRNNKKKPEVNLQNSPTIIYGETEKTKKPQANLQNSTTVVFKETVKKKNPEVNSQSSSTHVYRESEKKKKPEVNLQSSPTSYYRESEKKKKPEVNLQSSPTSYYRESEKKKKPEVNLQSSPTSYYRESEKKKKPEVNLQSSPTSYYRESEKKKKPEVISESSPTDTHRASEEKKKLEGNVSNFSRKIYRETAKSLFLNDDASTKLQLANVEISEYSDSDSNSNGNYREKKRPRKGRFRDAEGNLKRDCRIEIVKCDQSPKKSSTVFSEVNKIKHNTNIFPNEDMLESDDERSTSEDECRKQNRKRNHSSKDNSRTRTRASPSYSSKNGNRSKDVDMNQNLTFRNDKQLKDNADSPSSNDYCSNGKKINRRKREANRTPMEEFSCDEGNSDIDTPAESMEEELVHVSFRLSRDSKLIPSDKNPDENGKKHNVKKESHQKEFDQRKKVSNDRHPEPSKPKNSQNDSENDGRFTSTRKSHIPIPNSEIAKERKRKTKQDDVSQETQRSQLSDESKSQEEIVEPPEKPQDNPGENPRKNFIKSNKTHLQRGPPKKSYREIYFQKKGGLKNEVNDEAEGSGVELEKEGTLLHQRRQRILHREQQGAPTISMAEEAFLSNEEYKDESLSPDIHRARAGRDDPTLLMAMDGQREEPEDPLSDEGRSSPDQKVLPPIRGRRNESEPDHGAFKPYTLKDYKHLNLDVRLGGLGPHRSIQTVQEKLSKYQRQAEYAQQVSERNRRRMLARLDKPRSTYSQVVQDAEYEAKIARRKRAMEYARSIPRPPMGKMASGAEGSSPPPNAQDMSQRRQISVGDRHQRNKSNTSERLPCLQQKQGSSGQASLDRKRQDRPNEGATVSNDDLQRLRERHEKERQLVDRLRDKRPRKV